MRYQRFAISLLLAALTLVATACASTGQRFHDTKTIHDAQATRIWLVRDAGGEQAVVLCDLALFRQTGSLCQAAAIAPPRASVAVTVKALTPPAPPESTR